MRPKESEIILKRLEAEKEDLKKNFKVKRLGVFGSMVRDEHGKNSDVDILVEFDETISLFKFIELEDHLKKILRKKVDLVMKKALKPRLKKQILEEVKYL